MSKFVQLTFDGKTVELPVLEGTEHERGVDISKLRASTGLITYDPGLANTGSCKSAITFIDGEKGILRYRGYPIDQLAKQSSFLEVAYLLLNGELPSREELHSFEQEITYHTLLQEDIRSFYRGFPHDAHPMAITSSVVSALSTFYQDSLDPSDLDHVNVSAHRLIAKLPTIAAYAYKYSIRQPFMYPKNRLAYSQNILHMMFATPAEDYEVPAAFAKAIDVLLILHADHEQNCSTSTMRLVGSSRANLYASVSAAINALWGPLHGGANQKVIEMLEQIAAEEGSGKKFLEKCKDRNDTARLMGFGHRVYKNYDPRAKILKDMSRQVLDAAGRTSQLLDIALELEEMALKDDYFVSHKLYPNVDFYSGLIYSAMDIPINLFTVFFALGRLPGWIAQWIEQGQDEQFRIGRPRQIYTGATIRDYVPVRTR